MEGENKRRGQAQCFQGSFHAFPACYCLLFFRSFRVFRPVVSISPLRAAHIIVAITTCGSLNPPPIAYNGSYCYCLFGLFFPHHYFLVCSHQVLDVGRFSLVSCFNHRTGIASLRHSHNIPSLVIRMTADDRVFWFCLGLNRAGDRALF